jgi:4-amino-4-deoxy-L-arabinose transferase-like glycosyltransferase
MTASRRAIAGLYLSATGSLLRNERRWLVILFLLALSLRLAYIGLFVGFTSPPEYDGIGYNYLAGSLLAGRGYINYWGEPTAFRPPVYPIFLAGAYAVTGYSLAVVRLLQALLDSVTVLLVYGIARQLFGARVALLAGLGTAFYPLLIYETGLLIPETLSYTLQFAAVFCLVIMIKRSGLFLPALAGLLIGLTILARPTAAFWAPFILGWMLLPNLQPRALPKLLAVVVGLALTLGPWIVRNQNVFDAFVPISSNGAVNLWCGNNPLAQGGSVQPAQATWNGTDFPTRGLYGWEGLTEVESNRRFAAKGTEWIRENPVGFLLLIPKKLLRLWSPVAYSVQFGRQAPSRLLSVVILPYLLFLVLAAYGIFLTFRRWRETFPLLAIIISVNVMVIIYYGATRYSIPMGMSMMVFAALTLDRILDPPSAAAQDEDCEHIAVDDDYGIMTLPEAWLGLSKKRRTIVSERMQCC